MKEIQNEKMPLIRRHCRHCGSPRFKEWRRLTSEEREVAVRFPAAEAPDPDEKVYCARCLRPAGSPQTLA